MIATLDPRRAGMKKMLCAPPLDSELIAVGIPPVEGRPSNRSDRRNCPHLAVESAKESNAMTNTTTATRIPLFQSIEATHPSCHYQK